MPNLEMKILVVDDSSTMRQIIRSILKGLGYSKIFQADDGTSALEILKEEKLDFIISDWNMPKMAGIDLLKTVRTSEEWKEIPFLMVTAQGQQQHVIEAVKNKVSDYIIKPFNPKTLEEKIDKIFEAK
jgi:two-component system chemotaxis response regulator CheY